MSIPFKSSGVAIAVGFSAAFSMVSLGGENNVNCTGKKEKLEMTIPDVKGVITFSVNGTIVKGPKETWVFANHKRGIVPEELTLVADKNEYRFENLGTCPDGEAIRVRRFEISATTKVFLEEAACTCKAK